MLIKSNDSIASKYTTFLPLQASLLKKEGTVTLCGVRIPGDRAIHVILPFPRSIAADCSVPFCAGRI